MEDKKIPDKVKNIIYDIVANSIIQVLPKIVENNKQKKEEKSFFEENKIWIFTIILTIFVTQLNYINMFSNNSLNSIINIIFGCIVGILICLFLKEENIFKINSIFFKFLEISLIILGIINSFYHIGYAIFNLVI